MRPQAHIKRLRGSRRRPLACAHTHTHTQRLHRTFDGEVTKWRQLNYYRPLVVKAQPPTSPFWISAAHKFSEHLIYF